MSKIGWFALQLSIIGFFLYVETRSSDPKPGIALFIGICVAAFVTGLLSKGLDLLARMRASLTRRIRQHNEPAREQGTPIRSDRLPSNLPQDRPLAIR